MLRNNITIIMAMAAMLSVMTPVTVFAEVDIPSVEEKMENSGHQATKEYYFKLIPANSVIADKTGSNGIKITKGNVQSITLIGKHSDNVNSSGSTSMRDFVMGINWLYVTVESNGYGSFTTMAGYGTENGQLCAVIPKGTTDVNDEGIELEFTKDVVFRYDASFVDGDKYADNSDGNYAGWYTDNTYWYYTNTNDEDVTGWFQVDGKWYYFNQDGEMKTGWIQDGGNWYYCYSTGEMAHDTKINGYYIGSSGAWTN